MGWTWTHREPGVSHLDWFRREFGGEHPERLVAMTSVGTVCYGAWADEDGTVHGLVVLTGRAPNDYYNFGYKDMTETMGPNEARCPESILKLLSPLPECDLTDERHSEERPNCSTCWAREWRAACETYHAKRKARPKVAHGSVVRLARPVKFTNGFEGDTFTVERRKTARGGTKTFLLANGVRYRLNLSDIDYEVVS
jgi:hypothetical protein